MYKNVGEFACTLCALNIALFFIEIMELFQSRSLQDFTWENCSPCKCYTKLWYINDFWGTLNCKSTDLICMRKQKMNSTNIFNDV